MKTIGDLWCELSSDERDVQCMDALEECEVRLVWSEKVWKNYG